jgi:hypothetical protein
MVGWMRVSIGHDLTSEAQPQLLLLSSGETSIFELSLVAEDGWWMGLSSEGFGDFALSRTPIERD